MWKLGVLLRVLGSGFLLRWKEQPIKRQQARLSADIIRVLREDHAEVGKNLFK